MIWLPSLEVPPLLRGPVMLVTGLTLCALAWLLGWRIGQELGLVLFGYDLTVT